MQNFIFCHFLWLLSALLILNCSSEAEFVNSDAEKRQNSEDAKGDDSGKSTISDNALPDVDPSEGDGTEVEDPLPEDIADLCADGSRTEVRTVSVAFDPIASQCAWGENGSPIIDDDNKEDHNNYFSAHTLQMSVQELDQGARVCDISMEMEETEFEYDDHFMLLINERIIASSHQIVAEDEIPVFPTDDNGFYQYSFMHILGLPMEHGSAVPYCAAADAEGCIIPKTQEEGRLHIDVDDKVVQTLGYDAAQESVLPSLDFSMVMFGDNDPNVDCSHTGLTLKVSITQLKAGE